MNPDPGLEKQPCAGTLVDRGVMCREADGGRGVRLLSSKPPFQFVLVTTGTVRTPFFLGAREKGCHGNLSNPKARVLVITDVLI